MKVAVLKSELIDGELVFSVEGQVEDKTIEQLDEKGEFSESLKQLNIQRYLVRKSRDVDAYALARKLKI